jgi:hypothetical protein
VALDGTSLGLPVKTVYVEAPPVDDAAAPTTSMMGAPATREAFGLPRGADVHAFVEALIARGRVTVAPAARRRQGLTASLSQARKHATHYLVKKTDDALELKRIAFECW